MNAICRGQEDAEVATCSGMPVTMTDNKQVENIHTMLQENHSIKCEPTAAEVGISTTSVFHILTKHLGKRKGYTKLIPQCLTEDQCATCVVVHFTSPMMGEWSKNIIFFTPPCHCRRQLHKKIEDSLRTMHAIFFLSSYEGNVWTKQFDLKLCSTALNMINCCMMCGISFTENNTHPT